jgi:acetylglutamate kinase
MDSLMAHPDVQGGMRPKLQAARHAVQGGAPFARIAQWTADTLATLLAADGPGTTIVPDRASSPAPISQPLGGRS